jgi:putative exporter of polyketide antibiotics
VPNAPATAITAAPVLALGLVVVVVGAVGVVALRRRNLALPA